MKFLSARDKVGIFVSYRRADTAGQAGRLVDHLKSQFGDEVFFDVDSIKAGADFHHIINETLIKCGAVIVLIGKRWTERDESAPPFGDPKDVITQEIQATLNLNVPILPVLVDGAFMPGEATLPEQFKGLSRINAIDLRHTSFVRDLQAVSENIEEILGGAKATALEKLFLSICSPFLGSYFSRIWGAVVIFSAIGALWGLAELTAAGIVVSQRGVKALASSSIFDPELLRLQAGWLGALSGAFAGFLARRSVRWWRHATWVMWFSLAEMIVMGLLAFIYVIQVPDASVMELFEMKKSAVAR